MSDHSGISWLAAPGRIPATLNPFVGCQKASEGCAECYAIKSVWVRSHNPKIGPKFEGLVAKRGGKLVWTGKVHLWAPALDIPLRARAPRDYFIDELSDVFYERVKRADQDELMARVALSQLLGRRHRFILLTKRPEAMADYFSDPKAAARITKIMRRVAKDLRPLVADQLTAPAFPWPQLILGFSAETQAWFDTRWKWTELLAIGGWKTVASLEPMLGPIDIRKALQSTDPNERKPSLAWVLAGGLSAPLARHPGTKLSWIEDVVAACRDSATPLHVKQLGSRPIDDFGGREKAFPITARKGADPNEWPPHLRVRQYIPEETA